MEKHHSVDKQKTEKLPKLDWKIGADELWCIANVSQPSITRATTDLENWLNGKLDLYLG